MLDIDYFYNLIGKCGPSSFKTDEPSEHLSQLNKLINYYAPALRAQNGYFIQKVQKKVLAQTDNNGVLINRNLSAHILLGENQKTAKRVRLSTCLHNYKSTRIEIPMNQLPEYEKCDWLICANGNVWLIIDVDKLYNLVKSKKGDTDFDKLKQILTHTWINRSFNNFCITPEDLFAQDLVINFGYYSGGDIYEGYNQEGIRGVHKMEYKDIFGNIKSTKKNPVNFDKYQLKGCGSSIKFMLVRTEMSDSDLYHECKCYSTLKDIYNDLNYKRCLDLEKYRSFAKACKSDSDKALAGTISIRPKSYEIKSDCHYVVLRNMPLETAMNYAFQVNKKLHG